MIALFQIVLPAELLVLADETLPALTVREELEGVGEIEVLIHPPYRSQRSASVFRVGAPEPLFADIDKINPADPPPVEEMIEIEGAKVVRCDAIAVELRGIELDRSIGSAQTIPPLLQLACEAVNGVLARIRVLTRASHLKRLEPPGVAYRVSLLDDGGNLLPREEGKFRRTGNLGFRLRHVAVPPAVWNGVVRFGEYETPPWEELLLDATEIDIEIGPALVLAVAAIETRIANALDVLAGGKVPGDIWTWAITRGDDFTKTPSVGEELDVLLGALGDRSLKDDARLWEAWTHLRDGRNSFVHEGRAMIGKRRREPVAREKARQLVAAATEIIDFIEAQLPEEERRPRLDEMPTVTTTVMLVPGADEDAAGGEPVESSDGEQR